MPSRRTLMMQSMMTKWVCNRKPAVVERTTSMPCFTRPTPTREYIKGDLWAGEEQTDGAEVGRKSMTRRIMPVEPMTPITCLAIHSTMI